MATLATVAALVTTAEGVWARATSTFSDPPRITRTSIGDVRLGEQKYVVEHQYGRVALRNFTARYRVHSGDLSVYYDDSGSSKIRVVGVSTTSTYYRGNNFGVEDHVPLGPCHRVRVKVAVKAQVGCRYYWHGFTHDSRQIQKPFLDGWYRLSPGGHWPMTILYTTRGVVTSIYVGFPL